MVPAGRGAEMHFAGKPMIFHPRGCVHSVAKQAVPRHLVPHNTCQDWSRVDPHSDLPRENLTEKGPSNTLIFTLKLRYNLHKIKKT